MKNFIKRINRIFQDYMREKRLKIGKYIWDRKEKTKIIKGDNFIEDNNIKSILFLRYDGKIGDMIVNTLMFREIKKNYPTIKIGVVARGSAIDIIKDNPNVDKIYEYEKDRKKIKKLAEQINQEKYDLLIDFSEMLRVNQMMLINLCGARINLGLDRDDWDLFDTSVQSKKDFKWNDHITKRYLAYLKNFNIAVILVYFGDKYKELEILKEKYSNLYIPEEIKTILDTASLIKNCDYVITPDTSIVHVTSAFNKRIISVYPPKGGNFGVDHLVWFPKSDYSRVIFCKDKQSSYDEIDINTFNMEEMKKEILNMISNK